MAKVETNRASLYGEVTARVIGELEAGRLPWVQPWDSAACGCTMPHNAGTGRRYSGINVLILWAAVVAGGYASQAWLTYAQAQAAGGNVRRGEKGTVVCYADRFTPKGEAVQARDEDRDARQIAFLKRFTVFNVDQCEGLPEALTAAPEQPVSATTAARLVRALGHPDLPTAGLLLVVVQLRCLCAGDLPARCRDCGIRRVPFSGGRDRHVGLARA